MRLKEMEVSFHNETDPHPFLQGALMKGLSGRAQGRACNMNCLCPQGLQSQCSLKSCSRMLVSQKTFLRTPWILKLKKSHTALEAMGPESASQAPPLHCVSPVEDAGLRAGLKRGLRAFPTILFQDEGVWCTERGWGGCLSQTRPRTQAMSYALFCGAPHPYAPLTCQPLGLYPSSPLSFFCLSGRKWKKNPFSRIKLCVNKKNEL